jgi:hypothetical protein
MIYTIRRRCLYVLVIGGSLLFVLFVTAGR